LPSRRGRTAFGDAVRAEEIRRRDHGFKRSRIEEEDGGTEEGEAVANRRPRVEGPEAVVVEAAAAAVAAGESTDDDDDDDDYDEEDG